MWDVLIYGCVRVLSPFTAGGCFCVCISGFIVTISFQTYWVSVNDDDDSLLVEFSSKVTYQKIVFAGKRS